jgi:hypothetical protein
MHVLRRPPVVFWLYLAATVVAFGLSFAPSSVHTSYAWWGLVVWAGLLAALYSGSTIARRVLVFLGILAAFAGVAVQSGGSPLDVMATLISGLELINVALLLSPSMRRYTSLDGHMGAGRPLTS